MATRAYGRMVFWPGASLWVFGKRPEDPPFPRTAAHAHHAVQVTLALRGAFTLQNHDHRVSAPAAIVAPDVEHTFEAEELIAHLFVDPEGRPGRELQRELCAAGGIVAIATERLGDLAARLRETFEAPRRTDASLIDIGHCLLAQLAPGSERDERPEVRVRRMSAWAAERLDAPISLADAAKHVGLSSGRARHLFVEATGLPFRTYLLWLRLNRAIELYSGGSSLTAAAHGGGFSDSSHFSRTFRRMFGLAADSLRMF
jgi:AraC-like DNA-binding protein